MLKPIINLVIPENEAYKKTILFDTDNISLVVEDTASINNATDIPTYEILEPLDKFKNLEYKKSDMSYQTEIYVPIFSGEDDPKRMDYLMGEASRSLEYVKYPSIRDTDDCNVAEIYCSTMAGSDNLGDCICIFIGFFNGFIESQVVEDIMHGENPREKIKDVTRDERIDDIIFSINTDRRANGLPLIEYRYHMLDGKSVLLDSNIGTLLQENTEDNRDEVIDISIFDKISTSVLWGIFNDKKDIIKSNSVIVLRKEHMEELMKFGLSKATWKKHIQKGFFKLV